MQFISTRDAKCKLTLSEAMLQGLALDGGLIIPETIPRVDLSDFSVEDNYPDFCEKVLAPYFAGDRLVPRLSELCHEAFNFRLPLHRLNDNTAFLELFHGPTLSFKDFGARFLASCLSVLADEKEEEITIMVATSGDTGSAVASAFYHKPHIKVLILFPENKVSERQQQQMTCWGDNVTTLAVKGAFDDCQRLLKSAFQDPWFQKNLNLCTSNSINIGRLLPQICYYAYVSFMLFQQENVTPGFVVPSGNMGHVTAAFYAKAMGFPIREIAVASNANQVVVDYLQTGEYQPRPGIHTIANAMDVGSPSNFERLQHLFVDHAKFKAEVKARSVSDNEIKATIKKIYDQCDYMICPHTATAAFMREFLSDAYWINVATADPCKFETVIEPVIGTAVPVAPSLEVMMQRESYFNVVEPKLEALRAYIN